MNKFKTGDMVAVYFGKIPMVGPVVSIDRDREKYLVRFNPGQQMYYSEEELIPYEKFAQTVEG